MTTCKHCGQEIKELKLTKVAGFFLSDIQVAKDYAEAKKLCPKGFEMITFLEGIAVMKSKDKDFFLNYEKGNWRIFWCKQTEQDKKDGIAHRLYRDSGGNWGADGGNLTYSSEYGRVVYKKIEEKGK